MMKISTLRGDTSGISMLEVLASLMLISVVILGLTSAGVIAGDQLRTSRADTRVWTAVQFQLDALSAQGYDNVTAGTDTVQGYPMSWDVQGTNPKKIIMTVLVKNRKGAAVPDTFVTYLADWSP